jgi:hypothetical protein
MMKTTKHGRLLLALALLSAALFGCEDATFYIEGDLADGAIDAAGDVPPDADTQQDAPEEGNEEIQEEEDAPEGEPDPCEGVDCGGHGTCVVSSGSPECLCESGYIADGLTCVEDPCASLTCGSFAHCEAGECVCDEGYEGDPYTACTPILTEEDRIRALLVEIARAEIGYCEGVDSRPYMLDQPGYWCYDFVAWVYNQVDYPLPSPMSLTRFYTDSLPAGWRPEPGDLIKFDIQHYGMVAELSPDGTVITTVEGNYSSCVTSRSTGDGSVEYYGSLDDVF